MSPVVHTCPRVPNTQFSLVNQHLPEIHFISCNAMDARMTQFYEARRSRVTNDKAEDVLVKMLFGIQGHQSTIWIRNGMKKVNPIASK